MVNDISLSARPVRSAMNNVVTAITTLKEQQFRKVLALEDGVARGSILKAKLTVTAKAGTNPASLDIYLLDTEAHEELITIEGATNGTYTISIQNEDFAFVAVSSTITLIRDGLIALLDASAQTSWIATAEDSDKIRFTSPEALAQTTGFGITVTTTGSVITQLVVTGHKDGVNRFFADLTNSVDGANVPDPVIDAQQNPEVTFSLKGSNGVIQLIIESTGGGADTDYNVTLELHTRAWT